MCDDCIKHPKGVKKLDGTSVTLKEDNKRVDEMLTRATEPFEIPEGQTLLDWRSAQKKAQRKKDAEDIENGVRTPEQVQRDNSAFKPGFAQSWKPKFGRGFEDKNS